MTKFLVEVPDGVTVQFIDFGNSETVEAVYQYPACLGLELAPAAAEVVLARSLLSTGDAKKKVLEDCLMGEEEEKSSPRRAWSFSWRGTRRRGCRWQGSMRMGWR